MPIPSHPPSVRRPRWDERVGQFVDRSLSQNPLPKVSGAQSQGPQHRRIDRVRSNRGNRLRSGTLCSLFDEGNLTLRSGYVAITKAGHVSRSSPTQKSASPSSPKVSVFHPAAGTVIPAARRKRLGSYSLSRHLVNRPTNERDGAELPLVQSETSMIACIMSLLHVFWTGQEDVLIDIITLVVGVVVVVDSLSSTDDSDHKRLASGLRSSRRPINTVSPGTAIILAILSTRDSQYNTW
jgi:hypothetical protein